MWLLFRGYFMSSPRWSSVCLILDRHSLPISLPERDSLSQLVCRRPQAQQSVQETSPEVPLGCGNYEVSRKKPKNQEATWAESININIPEQAPALGFLCWCANMLATKGLFTPFWYSLQFIYLHKEGAQTGQFLMNKHPCVIPTAVYNPSCSDL